MSDTGAKDRLKEILPNIPDEDLELLAGICDSMTFKDKEVILKSGNRLRNVFLILEGAARGFIVDSEGDEKTILLRGKGIFVADASALFLDQPQKLEIVAIGPSEVLMFQFKDFEQLALTNQKILSVYMNSLKEAILRLSYRVESMITMSSEERYLDLLKLNPSFLEKSYDKYVASFLGITPVSLSRIKKRLDLSN
jgi:CRP-like cAMP-binding protein